MAAPAIPDAEQLLPPLLACLPTSFVSPRPPPALAPLLSPILRQRLQYAADGGGVDGWLPLLTWDATRASRLAEKLEDLVLEPHPVSGELEIEHTGRTHYKRLDEETLHVRFELQQYGLLPVYVWCEQDTQSGTGPGWKLSELRTIEDVDDGTMWYASMGEANHAASLRQSNGTNEQEDDDDDYWASYDRTPGPTPTLEAATKPAPSTRPAIKANAGAPTSADDDYYASYDTVQPALDDHDPDEEDMSGQTKSTLGSTPLVPPPQPVIQQPAQSTPDDKPVQRSLYPKDPPARLHLGQDSPLSPRPISPSSATSEASVEKLERTAQAAADMTQAERGVKQFIGSEIRNLFRLARSVGMDVDDFRETVGRELQVVSMLEDG